MGNRANVVFASQDWKELSPTVYLHWNGGPESVYAFLEELNRREVRADQCYETARFCQIVGEFFDQDSVGSTSLGIMNTPEKGKTLLARLEQIGTDKSDNGFYVVARESKNMKVRRFMMDWEKSKATDYKDDFLTEISEVDVAEEKKKADEHEYRKGIREFFLTLTANKKTEAVS